MAALTADLTPVVRDGGTTAAASFLRSLVRSCCASGGIPSALSR